MPPKPQSPTSHHQELLHGDHEEDLLIEKTQHGDHHELVAIITTKNPLSYEVKERSVRFSAYDDTTDTLNLDSYSTEEKQAAWYTREELHKMQLERQEEHNLLESHQLVEDDTHTARGLETFEERCYREELTCRAIDCVLDEQDSQFADGIEDQDYIGMLYEYFCLSHRCSSIACQRAAKDHEECIAYYAVYQFTPPRHTTTTSV